MSKKVAMFAAVGKSLKKFMLIYLYKSSFLFFSIPKFSLKSWVPPFIFGNLSPLSISLTLKFFQVPLPFEIFKIWVPPF